MMRHLIIHVPLGLRDAGAAGCAVAIWLPSLQQFLSVPAARH
jgi:hypothetical protein